MLFKPANIIQNTETYSSSFFFYVIFQSELKHLKQMGIEENNCNIWTNTYRHLDIIELTFCALLHSL